MIDLIFLRCSTDEGHETPDHCVDRDDGDRRTPGSSASGHSHSSPSDQDLDQDLSKVNKESFFT